MSVVSYLVDHAVAIWLVGWPITTLLVVLIAGVLVEEIEFDEVMSVVVLAAFWPIGIAIACIAIAATVIALPFLGVARLIMWIQKRRAP